MSVFCHATIEKNGSESSNLFEYANSAYSEGNYQKAISIYEKIMTDHGVSASLLYNLGNSYAENGQPGKAILNYERALLISFKNFDIVTNLHGLKEKVGSCDRTESFLVKTSNYLVYNHWLIFTLGGIAGLLLVYLLSHSKSLARITQLVSVSCSILVIGVSSVGVITTYTDHRSAVVIKDDTDLLISPFSWSGSRSNTFEGQIVTSEGYYDGYYLVKDNNGGNGWLPEASIEFIIPPQK